MGFRVVSECSVDTEFCAIERGVVIEPRPLNRWVKGVVPL